MKDLLKAGGVEMFKKTCFRHLNLTAAMEEEKSVLDTLFGQLLVVCVVRILTLMKMMLYLLVCVCLDCLKGPVSNVWQLLSKFKPFNNLFLFRMSSC